MLDRLFGNDGFFGAGGWWIIVLFFLFLAFGDSWADIDIMDTIFNTITNNSKLWFC